MARAARRFHRTAALAVALALLAVPARSIAGTPPAGAVEIGPGQTLGGEIAPSDGNPAVRYAVDAGRTGGMVGFRIEVRTEGNGVCGARITDRPEGSISQHQAGSGRSVMSATVGVVRGWVLVELYTTAARCAYEVRVK